MKKALVLFLALFFSGCIYIEKDVDKPDTNNSFNKQSDTFKTFNKRNNATTQYKTKSTSEQPSKFYKKQK